MNKKILGALLILILSFFLFFLERTIQADNAAQEQNRPGLSIKETFDIYVRSIQNSDLEALFTTVTEGEKFFFLTSTGKLISSRQDYYTFHEDWFKEEDWEMPVEYLEGHEGQEYGYATAIFHYRSKRSDGGTAFIDSYFTLIFHREDNMWKVVADVCTPIDRSYSDPDSDIRYPSEQAFLFDTLKSRRTVRRFKALSVPKEHIIKILDAARFAPTAGNQQPWKFLVIQDRKKLDELKKQAFDWYMGKFQQRIKPNEEERVKTEQALQERLDNVLSAPVYVAVLVDSSARYPDYTLQDGVLAAGQLMIAARSLGYGSGFFTTFFPEKEMKEFFKIPDKYKLICFTPIGIPYEWPATPEKKKIEDLVVFDSF
jgi:nitroreductase/ketosteroid isomerase-like protein